MPVSTDSSFVPDSTAGISPVSTPAVKRAVRTYGRPRHVEPSPGDDSDTSLMHSAKSSGSRSSIYRTGPRDLDEEVPQTSDPLSDGRDDDDDTGHEVPFAFSWRDKLKEIDDREDFEMDVAGTGEENYASPSREESNDEPALSLPRSQTTKTAQLPTSPIDSGIDTLAEEVFGGSLDTLTASSVSPPKSQPSPQPVTSTRRRIKHTIHDSDSDSDDENTKESSTTSPSSFHDPTSQSTPPTSQGDMSTNSKHDSKGKTKPSARRDGAPLLFDKDTASSSTIKPTRASSKDKRKKIKAPTKKELRDTARHRIRIAAEQQISIPRAEAPSHLSLHSFFLKLQSAAPQAPVHPTETDADPIEAFSDPVSASPHTHPTPFQSDGSPLRSQNHQKMLHRTLDSFPDSDDDKDLPELGAVLAREKADRDALLAEEKAKRDRAKRDHDLKELKLRALAASSKVQRQDNSDSDDDLQVTYASQNPQIAVKEEADERKYGRKKRVSEGRKRQLNLGGIGLAKQKLIQTPTKVDDLQVLKGTRSQKGKTVAHPTTQAELNRVLAARVEAARLKATQEKQEEWKRRGGKIRETEEGMSSSVRDASMLYAEKGLKLPLGHSAMMEVDEDDEEEGDEDWVPGAEERGSASPSPPAVDSGSEEDKEQPTFEDEEDITMVNDTSPTATQDEDTLVRLPKPRRPTIKHIIESDSEGENDENSASAWTPSTLTSTRFPNSTLGAHSNDDNARRQPHSKLSVLSRRRSVSSMDDHTEDEGDKENETSRMWDRGDDKENRAVVRHNVGESRPAFGSRQGSLFGLEVGLSRGLSMSPGRQDASDEDGDEEKTRRPFKELMDDPFASPSRSTERPTSFEARLKQASPVSVSLTRSLTPFIGGSMSLGFSDDEPTSVLAPAPLEASFSDLFESGTERPKAAPLKRTTSEMSGSFSGPAGTKFAGTSFNNDLSLTQDITLQPAFQVSENLLRKADQIFEKEQEYVLEAANKKPQAEAELYVNDHGFLTQTRPDDCSPQVYRPPTPTQDAAPSPSEPQAASLRRPLRTISLADELDFESESPGPLGRLRKRGATPTSPLLRSGRTSISPSPSAVKRPANAFDVMKRAAKDRADKPKRKLERSEFVEQEAQESDDDDIFGFGPRKTVEEEEEDGEDLDQPLAALVDDKHMDEEAIAAQLVIEKYKEQEQADDLELEKLHQAAVQGELRKKRRKGGIDMDDSDDDSEDEKNRRIRQSMHKKQRIDRDNIKALGEHEETKSFFAVYENDLAADGTDFSYLEVSQPQDVDMANEEEDREEQPREVVSVTEIVQRARELARQPQDVDHEPLDPNNVDWIEDGSDEEETPRVKPVKNTKKQPMARPRGVDLPEVDGATDMPPPKSFMEGGSIDRMRSWAKLEGRSRQNGTTGRSVGGAAVTGHKAKSGGGSLRSAASSASSKPAEQRRPVKAQPSLLASVAAERRTTRFG